MYLKVTVTCPLAIYTSQMLLLNSFSCQEGEHPVSLEASANKAYLAAAAWCPPLAAQGDFEYAQTKLGRLQDALSWPETTQTSYPAHLLPRVSFCTWLSRPPFAFGGDFWIAKTSEFSQ